MSVKNSLAWFKSTFAPQISQAIVGTPICENLLAAIAYQETGYIWGSLAGSTSIATLLRLCVGDTIDAPRRGAFPISRAELERWREGERMFRIARQALVELNSKTGLYGSAARNPSKFCHGFGIFQYDLQFFKEDPEYFLSQGWASFDQCLSKCMSELKVKLRKVFGAGKTSLSDLEKAYLAIAYNTGGFNPSKGLKQGFKNEDGEYYGEQVYEFYLLAKSIAVLPTEDPKRAIVVVEEHSRSEPIVSLPGSMIPPQYPGRIIERNDADTDSVKLVQKRLRALGYTERNKKGEERPLSIDGDYGLNTQDAVELFQFRHSDNNGRELVVDGEVGPATWAALFGLATLPSPVLPAGDSLPGRVIEVATAEIGVREEPLGSNRGRRVNEYLGSVGLDGGYYWCAAFVYWCFREAARQLGVPNVAIKTAGVLDMWNKARTSGFVTVSAKEAAGNPSLVKPGMIFAYSTGGGHGHTGIVTEVSGLEMGTIEGNTDPGGSSNGIGVFRRHRSITSINCGFIDYSRKS